jgi:hypothetical protein
MFSEGGFAVRFSIVIAGCAALTLAACGGSGSATGSSSAGTRSTAIAGGGVKGGIAGQITRLGGDKMVVKGPSGNVTVTYSPSTNVLLTSSATQSNVVAGACVVVTGRREPAGPVTADTVQVQYNMNGKCAPLPGVVLGRNGPGNAANLRGKVTRQRVRHGASDGGWCAGGRERTLDGSITRQDTATTNRLAVGQCVQVNGQQDAAGVVQARALIISMVGLTACTGPSGSRSQPSRSATPGA